MYGETGGNWTVYASGTTEDMKMKLRRFCLYLR